MTRANFLLFMLMMLSGWLFACKKDSSGSSIPPVTPTPNPVVPSGATTYYVSQATGNDTRTAAQAKDPNTPWKTIQKAANNIPGGATVIISGGTYTEKVTLPATCSGTAAAPTVFKSKDGDTAIIDGGNTGQQWESLLKLNNLQHLKIQGIKAQNGYWYGISAEGCTNITIEKCATFNTRASGIYVKACNTSFVNNNNIRRACQYLDRDQYNNGSQECISIVGCTNFKVFENEIWDTNASGSGGEGIDAKGGSGNGEIYSNYIHDLYRIGIYIDAGSGTTSNIRVYGNRVYNGESDGLSVAGELGGTAKEIFFYNNIIKDCARSGFVFQSVGNGRLIDIYVVNNTFYNNAKTGFAGDIGNYNKNTGNSHIVVKNNIFYNRMPNYRFSIWHDVKAPHVISNNLYFEFKSSNNGANSFASTDLRDADVTTNPDFVDAGAADFRLQAGSPAIGKAVRIEAPGSPATPLFTTDFDGKDRGQVWDMGAYEK